MTQIKIEKFKTELGENYSLVKTIWDQICIHDFYIECLDPLGQNETPIDQCTDLEKILLACASYLSYLKDNENEVILTEIFLLTVYQNHNQICRGATIKIRGPFFIVVE